MTWLFLAIGAAWGALCFLFGYRLGEVDGQKKVDKETLDLLERACGIIKAIR